MKILFICKYNRFRSRVAEAYFKKINRNKKIKVSSAGLIKGSSVSKNTIRVAKKFDINVAGSTKTTSENELLKTDFIVIVAHNVPKSIFKRFGKTIIVWKIKDASQNDEEGIKIIKKIIKRVKKLVNQLEDQK